MTASAHDVLIERALIAWFVLTALSAAYVAWDALRNTPEMPVMKWGWVLVTLYTGPVGACLYVLSCKEPRPGAHESFITPLWKQALGSTIHCLAGDATGIILAATFTLALGLPMWVDTVAEYAFGFAVGLFVFQALFMRDMLGGSYAAAVRRSFLPEWLSMNAVMAGMIPVMVVLMGRDMRAMEPTSLRYWGVMSLATLVGFAAAYPVNVWLVAAGLKHGMGTVRALSRGGHDLATEAARIPATSGERPAPDSAPARAAHAGHQGSAGRGGEMPNAEAAQRTAAGHAAGGARHGPAASPPAVSRPQLTAVAVLTLLQLAAGVFLASLGGDFAMRSGAAHEMGSGAAPAPPGEFDRVDSRTTFASH